MQSSVFERKVDIQRKFVSWLGTAINMFCSFGEKVKKELPTSLMWSFFFFFNFLHLEILEMLFCWLTSGLVERFLINMTLDTMITLITTQTKVFHTPKVYATILA